MGKIKLFPLVATAALCLLIMKTGTFFFSNKGVLTGAAPATAQDSVTKLDGTRPLGKQGVKDPKPNKMKIGEQEAKRERFDEPSIKGGTMGPEMRPTKSEFAVLQRLAERRTMLENQAREISLKENLIRAAEKRVEARIKELKEIESRIKQSLKKQEELESEKFNKLVKMYSNMKPKQAARIFNRLNLDVLLGLVQRMKARKMSAILAQMNPAQAERLTVEIANQEKKRRPRNSNLPKIGSGENG